MPVNRLTYTSGETVRRVYALARVLAKVFQEAGLRYWTSGGTTLGIVRSASFSRSGTPPLPPTVVYNLPKLL